MKKVFGVFLVSLILVSLVSGTAYARGTNPIKRERVIKTVLPNGKIPSQWNLPKLEFRPHPDVPMNDPSAVRLLSGGDGDGSNDISFSAFESGDMIVVTGFPLGHAGEWDASEWDDSLEESSYCIWSANTVPEDGVQLEQPSKYWGYDEAVGIWVPSLSTSERADAVTYCAAQDGEPYEITSLKTTETDWYCSKLCWASYWFTAGLDLDADAGVFVYPVDLAADDDIATFAYSN